MRRTRAAVLAGILLLTAPIAPADTFRLTNGTEYHDATLSRVEPDGLMIVTKTGIVKLYFTDLPEETRQKYHYDRKKAESFRFRLNAAKAAAREEVDAANETRPQMPAATVTQTAKLRSLSLDAHEIGTADGFQSYWETDWGSYDRDFTRGKTILVTLRDLSRKVRRCEIDVYFIARPVFSPNVHFIYDHEQFFPELKGRMEISGPVHAPDLHARILNLAAEQRRYGKGADMDGWIVVGRVGDQIFGVRASSQTLLEIAQGNPRQPESLAQMIAEYEESNRN